MEGRRSAGIVDTEIFRSQIQDLDGLLGSYKAYEAEATDSDSERLVVSQYAFDLEGRVKQLLSQSSVAGSFGPEDSSAFLEQLREELHAVETNKIKVSDEIEVLTKSVMADSEVLGRDLEWLKCSSDYVESLDLEKVKSAKCRDCFYRDNSAKEEACHKFEILDLHSEIEKNNKILKSVKSIDREFKRYDVIEQIEDALSGLKIIEYDQNSIRLSLETFVQKFDRNQVIFEDAIQSPKVNHELLIEVVDGNLEIKSAQIFPNDVYIADIVDAAISFRQSFSQSMVPQTSLEWFVRKAQERIAITSMRRSVVKSAYSLRYSAEYLEKDGNIIAHFDGGIAAILKIPQGWPIYDFPLELISLNYSGNGENLVPLSTLREVEEAAKSMEAQKRVNLLGFLDAIEAMLLAA